jgi:hypothetical protein
MGRVREISTERGGGGEVVSVVSVMLTVRSYKGEGGCGKEMGCSKSAHPCQENFVCDKSPSCGIISSLETKKTAQELV